MKITGTAIKLGAFALVLLLFTAIIIVVFGQMRFDRTTGYTALFSNASGLRAGQFVRASGVEVGKVSEVELQDGGRVAEVHFSVERDLQLFQGTTASIRYLNLIGDRYMELKRGDNDQRLPAGSTIPMERTEPALDLDALVGGFRPLFRALDPNQVNALSGQLISAFQGQGATIGSFLTQTAALTSTLADRDQLIGEVIVNLNTVLGSLGDQSDQFAKGVDSLADLIKGLEARKTDIANGLAYTNAAAGSIADLLSQARPPFQKVITETDRAAGIVVADHDYFDNLVNTLPDAYQALARQGIYGDYFSFYLCDIVLKLNGKGGQPVYVKVAGQSTGRCTPR